MDDKIVILGTMEITCPECGHKQSYHKIYDESLEYGQCMSCGKITFQKSIKPIVSNYSTTATCPYCGSKSTKKISGLSKAASVAAFGVFAIGKVSKQWHCNRCGSNF